MHILSNPRHPKYSSIDFDLISKHSIFPINDNMPVAILKLIPGLISCTHALNIDLYNYA